MPDSPLHGIVLMFLIGSPVLLLVCGLQYAVFRWIVRGLAQGEHRAEWFMQMMRRKALYAGSGDEAICRSASRLCLMLMILFGLALAGATTFYIMND